MALRDLPLSIKAAGVVLMAALLPVLAMAGTTWLEGRKLLTAALHENLAAHADRVAEALDAFNDGWAAQAATLASSRAVKQAAVDEAEAARARELFDAVVARDARVSTVSLVNQDGVVLLSSARGQEGSSVAGRTWFPDAQAGRPIVGQFVVLPGATESPVLEYAHPLGAGGFVLVSARADAFWDAARSVARASRWKGSSAVVLDAHGIRLAHATRPDLLYRPTGPLPEAVKARALETQRFGSRTAAVLEPVPQPVEYQWATAPTAGDESLQQFPADGDAPAQLATARRTRTVPWTVVSLVPSSAVVEPVSTLLTELTWRTLLVLALAVGLALFLVRRTLAPLRTLSDAARRWARGEPAPPVVVDRGDEVGELSTQFNAMTDALSQQQQQLEHRVKARTRELELANEELRTQQDELRTQREELSHQNEEVARANQLKSAFLANMSHELRTPLNSVIGFSDLLSEDVGPQLDERHRRYLHDVRAAGKHLLTLINDILDLSKIEAGHLELHVGAVAATEALTHARGLVAGTALTRGVQLVEDRRSVRAVKADPEKLQQILVNLLSNAVKFSEAGTEVVLGVEDRGDLVRFFVKDHGPGIDPAVLPRLFEPFVQGENPLIKRHQGTGLGLAITRRLVERHGAQLEVDTRPGHGATFSFELPVAREAVSGVVRAASRPLVLLLEPDEPRAGRLREALTDAGYDVAAGREGEALLDAARRLRPQVLVLSPAEDARGIAALKALKGDPQTRRVPVVLTTAARALGVLPKPLEPDEVVSAVQGATRAGGRRVLAVDDDPRALELVRATLTPQGFEVQTAASAPQALEAMRREAPDVVLTDLLMPGMSGFDFVDVLAKDEALRHVPVLVLTALDLTSEQRERLKRHVSATARKGDITAAEVVEAVGRLTRGHVTRAAERGTVLVVDDHDLNRELARAMLERRGFAVLQAEGGAQALELARSASPQLVLMDLAMPGMDGFEALAAMRADARTRGIPVIALTALAMKTDQQAVQRAGFDGYVTKPVDALRLDAEVDRVLARATAQARA